MKNTVLFISSSGGHLVQLLKLAGVAECNKILITERCKSTSNLKFDGLVLYLPHGGRERPLSFLVKFFWNFILSFYRILIYRPSVVVSTGAHTAVPSIYLAKLFGARVVYFESFAKIDSPSLTGRLVYPLADVFYVQWEQMKEFYPKARFCGAIY